jgi:uncharacterized membrane protein YeaQ/YmgE (transglycosylase-associated protein family)
MVGALILGLVAGFIARAILPRRAPSPASRQAGR